MKRLTALVAAMLVIVAACGDSGGGDDPAQAGTCGELVATAVGFVQDMLDAVSELSLDDIAALGEEEPAAFQELADRALDVAARGRELGCRDEELEAEFADRVDDLEADGPFAQLILDGMKSEGFGFGE